ncbi:hypothetical protein [Stutzerimonas stutzeri]|uniref:hypothetical protein n=1 Tax=Stutzerimonas stutzeri TaxID=316 RepID=UPI001553A539|nr:hypothetical protein [Stutzerimonas stutzeri]
MNRRYLVALLWHWSIPFVLGVCVSAAFLAFQLLAVGPEMQASFEAAIGSYCGAKQ